MCFCFTGRIGVSSVATGKATQSAYGPSCFTQLSGVPQTEQKLRVAWADEAWLRTSSAPVV